MFNRNSSMIFGNIDSKNEVRCIARDHRTSRVDNSIYFTQKVKNDKKKFKIFSVKLTFGSIVHDTEDIDEDSKSIEDWKGQETSSQWIIHGDDEFAQEPE